MAQIREGFRVREARKRQGMTQTALAKDLGISVSYLNLIEHNKRSIGGRLLSNIASVLGVDLNQLAGYEDARLIQDLTNLSGDTLFRNLTMDDRGAEYIIGRAPGWGRAFLRLHGAYLAATEMVEALSDRLNRDRFLVESSHEILTQITAIRSFAEILEEYDDLSSDKRQRYISLLAEVSSDLSGTAKELFAFMDQVNATTRPTTPAGEVEDLFIDHRNFFPELEQAAEALRTQIEVHGNVNDLTLVAYLARRHGLGLQRPMNATTGAAGASAELDEPAHTDYAVTDGNLVLREWHPPETVRFLVAQFIFEREQPDILDAIVTDQGLTSDDARRQARRALARYAAGAVLFPYAPFLRMAEDVRYDIQVLQQSFGGSFEQVCHRLVTLQQPGSRSVPFVYLRSDPAGNITKRFSLSNLRLPRYGGACPLWAVYRAFLSPRQIISQRVRMPDDQEFLFVARTVNKQARAYGASEKVYSVMIGCDAVYADRLVYGDGKDKAHGNLIVDVGINCRLCPRPNCDHRAYAPILPVAN